MATRSKTPRYLSPLRYPGGKGKVANFLKLVILENSLEGVRYIEPYAGGASVGLALLAEKYVSHVHINDLNIGVYSFWKYILDQPESFCRRIMQTPLSIEEWHRQKEIYSSATCASDDLGFATFYLNRTNRSGIISRGGVIGGIEQLGKWKMDARFDRVSLCSRIMLLAGLSSRISVSNADAVEIVSNRSTTEGSLLYLDPPYYVKGSGLYDNFYSHADHRSVRDTLSRVDTPWIVSYDAAPEVLKLYSDYRNLRYTLGYSASSVSQGTEVMFFSPHLVVPSVSTPSGITSADFRRYQQGFKNTM